MIIRIIKLYLFFIIFTGCSSAPLHIQQCNQTVGTEAKRLEKEENLHIFGYGGAMCDNITKITLDFIAFRRVTLNEARRICVRCIEEIKVSLNANKKLEPYLNPYPFPISGMNIGISFFNENFSFVDYKCAYLGFGGVSYVFQLNNTLFYSSHNPKTLLLEPYYEEPYETALAILRGEYPETDEEAVRRANKRD